MALLSSTVNPFRPGTLPSNNVQSPKNDGHCMEVITRVGKKTIDPPIPFDIENEIRGYDEVVEVSEELGHKTGNEAEVP